VWSEEALPEGNWSEAGSASPTSGEPIPSEDRFYATGIIKGKKGHGIIIESQQKTCVFFAFYVNPPKTIDLLFEERGERLTVTLTV